MTRLAQVVFGVLVASAFAAFFVAQQLKTSPSVVQSFKVKYPVVSPNGDGRLDRQRVTFRLKRADTVDVAVVDDQGDVVRELASGQPPRRLPPAAAEPRLGRDATTPAGPAPDGVYRIRITLRGEGRSVIVPKAFRVDRTPPAPRILSIGPDPRRGPELLPHPSGAPARIRLSAPVALRASCASSACGPARRSRSPAIAIPDGATIVHWDGTDGAGHPAPPAPYLVVAEVRDKAGNIGTSVPLTRARAARRSPTDARCPATAGSPSAASPCSRR